MESKNSCLACGSEDYSFWAKSTDREYCTGDNSFRFLRCNNCDALFIDPVPKNSLGKIYPPNYYSFVEKKNGLAGSVKLLLDKLHFASVLKKIDSQAINVLDVGGGNGWLLSIIKPLDRRINRTQVVDIDSNAGVAALGAGHEYYEGTIENFDSNIKFHLVLLLNIIEHVEDPGSILSHISGMLAPNGVVLIKTPNTKSLDARIFRHKDWGGLHTPRHWALFNKSSFEKLLGSTNLEIKEFSYTQGAPFWAFSTLFFLQDKGLVNISADRPAYSHPLFGILQIIFAAFDYLRKPFFPTSQMFIVLKKIDERDISGDS